MNYIEIIAKIEELEKRIAALEEKEQPNVYDTSKPAMSYEDYLKLEQDKPIDNPYID